MLSDKILAWGNSFCRCHIEAFAVFEGVKLKVKNVSADNCKRNAVKKMKRFY